MSFSIHKLKEPRFDQIYSNLSRQRPPLQMQSSSWKEIEEVSLFFIRIFGDRKGVREHLEGKIQKSFDRLKKSFKEIHAHPDLPVCTKEKLPSTWEIINGNSALKSQTVFQELKSNSLYLFPFLQQAPLCFQQDPQFRSLSQEMHHGFRTLCEMLDPPKRKNGTLKELSPEKKIALSQLLYARGAIYFEEIPFSYGDVLRVWADGNPERTVQMERVLEELGMNSWSGLKKIAPEDWKKEAQKKIGFQDFLIEISLILIQKKIGTSLPLEVVFFLKKPYLSQEEIRSDLVYFMKQETWEQKKSDANPILNSIGWFLAFKNRYLLSDENVVCLIRSIFLRNTKEPLSLQFTDIWRPSAPPVDRPPFALLSNRNSPIPLLKERAPSSSSLKKSSISFNNAIDCLNAMKRLVANEAEWSSYEFLFLCFFLKHRDASIYLLELLIELNKFPIDFSVFEIYEFCKLNSAMDLSGRDKLTQLIQSTTHSDRFADLLFHSPYPLHQEHRLLLEKNREIVNGYLDFLYSYSQQGAQWVSRKGTESSAQKLFDFLKILSDLESDLSREMGKRAEEFVLKLDRKYFLNFEEGIDLYLKALSFKGDEDYTDWKEIDAFLDQRVSFFPAVSSTIVSSFFLHPETRFLTAPLFEKWERIREEYGAMDRSKILLDQERLSELIAALTVPLENKESNGVLEASFNISLFHSLFPPVQPLTDALKLQGVDERGIFWRTELLISHLGELKPVIGKGPLAIYSNWQLIEGKDCFVFCFYDLKEGKGESRVFHFPFFTDSGPGEPKRKWAFCRLFEISQAIFSEDKHCLDPVFLEAYIKNPTSSEEEFGSIFSTGSKDLLSKEEIGSIFSFVQKLKIEYRNVYLSFMEQRSKGIPLESREKLPFLSEGMIEICRNQFLQTVPKPEFQRVELHQPMEIRENPIFTLYYKIKTLDGLRREFNRRGSEKEKRDRIDPYEMEEKSYDTAFEKKSKSENKEYLWIFLSRTGLKKEGSGVPMKYPIPILRDPFLFGTYFKLHYLMLHKMEALSENQHHTHSKQEEKAPRS